MAQPVDGEFLDLVRREQADAAVELALRTYGGEIFSYLMALDSDADRANDAFARFAEGAWKSATRFRGDASLRTWLYAIARASHARVLRDTVRRRQVPLGPISQIVEQVRSQTASYLRTPVKERVRELRAQLPPDERELLILRVDRELPWREVAIILAGEELDDAEITKQAAALRKRFERVTRWLREQLRS